MTRSGILLFVTAVALLLSGCTFFPRKTDHSPDGMTTVEHLIGNEQFQKENLPMRTLRIAIIADTVYNEQFVRETFFQASASLEQQVGVRLNIVHFEHGILPHRSVKKTFMLLAQKCTRLPAHDITIGITYIPPAEDDMNMEKPSAIGIANHLLGNIHLRRLSPRLIVHEVGHLLLGHTGHSAAGVMQNPSQDIYFTITDRRIILSRKHSTLRPCTPPVEAGIHGGS